MTVRDERAAALIRRHRDLSDDFTRALPGLLDEMEAIDEAHNLSEMPRTGAEAAEWARPAQAERSAPTDAQIAAWIERNPKAFADWAAKQNRISGGVVWPGPGRASPAKTGPVPVSEELPKAAPATRRRTTR
jgi:hypothetical protein